MQSRECHVMTDLLHELILKSAQLQPHAPALKYKDTQLSYETLANAVSSFARGLLGHGLQRLHAWPYSFPTTPMRV